VTYEHGLAQDALYYRRKVLVCDCGAKWLTEYDDPFFPRSTFKVFNCICKRRLPLYDETVVMCVECPL
jgi:hypothetical protein